jgi:hypothetical protein
MKYITLEFIPPPLSFIPLPQFLEQFQQVSLLHLYTCIHIICTVLILLPPFPATSPPTYATLPPLQNLFSDFVEKKIKDKKKNVMFFLV